MLFGHHTVDKTMDEHLSDIAALASDPQTLVFLDTNILAYLYKLHDAARQEFFAWSDTIADANRLVVPAWAASEYLSRVTSKALDSYTPKGKEPSQAKKAMLALHEAASLFVDDSLLHRIGYPGSRAAFLTGFRDAIRALDPFISAFSHEFAPGVIHQQVVEHLSTAILDSDLAALCIRASQEGNARFEHRIPPGFRDSGKPENRFGDLIIWFEILDKATASAIQFPKVLFITNDEKSDWVYAPTKRIELVRGTRKPVANANPEIKLADPRLVSEFRRKTEHSNLVICSLASLVEGLSKVDATRFAQLAAAIQINTQEAVAFPPDSAQPDAAESEIPIVPPAPVDEAVQSDELPFAEPQEALAVEPTEFVQPRLNYAPEALRDSEYQADVPSDINAIIRALKSHNWYTQNPAITSIKAIRYDEFPPSSWFVLGRNVYQAACGNSQKAMEFMATLETQLAHFPDETAQHVLAGMLFEIYFDAQGQFREFAKISYADKPLTLAADHSYDDVRIFILFHLYPHRRRLIFMPGDLEQMNLLVVSTPTIQLDDPLDLTPSVWELRSVKLNDVELLGALVDDGWTGQLQMRRDTLKTRILEGLAIPSWALASRFEPQVPDSVRLVAPEGMALYPELALQIAGNDPSSSS